MATVKENILKVMSTIPVGVTLVAVSKFHPVESLREAYNVGQRVFGESRVQELVQKSQEMPSDTQWHFIGHLQTNKVRQLLSCNVALIHSVDSLKLLSTIDAEAKRAGKTVDVLLQIHVAREQTKFGFSIEELETLACSADLLLYNNVRVRGIMAMASNIDDDNEIRKEFRCVHETFERIKSTISNNSVFDIVSMGMSDDRNIAIQEGSTMVRVGTAIFGEREY